MLRVLLWRLVGMLAALFSAAALAWLLGGGLGRTLRGGGGRARDFDPGALPGMLARDLAALAALLPAAVLEALAGLGLGVLGMLACVLAARARARRRRTYVRMRIEAYRGDVGEAAQLARMFTALHGRVLARWWRRATGGQPSFALEAHYGGGDPPDGAAAWLALVCPRGEQVAYPNSRLVAAEGATASPRCVLRLKKRRGFLDRTATAAPAERAPEPPMNRLLTTLGACGREATVQFALTPAPLLFERIAHHAFRHRENRLSRERREGATMKDRSTLLDTELRGGLELQHRALFFADLRVIGPTRAACEQVAAVLRVQRGENQLVERGTAVRHGGLGLYTRRVQRGEGNPLAGMWRSVFSPEELAQLWQLPSSDYATVPFARTSVPIAPAAPAIMRAPEGQGILCDALGPVTIHPELRRQNTAVPGAVEQGKSSYLVATVAEDLRRERCAVIVLDPKGDAAESALSAVPEGRVCTLLDFARPTCGFNPLAVDAPADVIAVYVVGALKNLFTDADIRASSDRFLRNATIAVLAHDSDATLWDAARLLSVGEEGYAYRRAVGARVRSMPELKEISAFFTAELTAQLADARSMTTAKLDAPVNKLARLLNSASIKRVLLNDSLRLDFDGIIARGEVLVVKGALGAMGAGNTSVLMQLLVGMLDAALARQQDGLPPERRIAVALKIDEAPLVLNRGFAETMALKRSAGLETVACWQADSQWVDREVRDQLDALFAHRVYFATASARDARASVALTMSEFSDTVRPETARLAALGRPDVRLRLPKHHAIVSWTTPEGRQPAFVAQTLAMRVDPARLEAQAEHQQRRGGRYLSDLRQPHWERDGGPAAGKRREVPAEPAAAAPAKGPAEVPAAAAPAQAPAETPAAAAPARARLTPLPAFAAVSYRELAAIDRAHSIRVAPVRALRPLERPEELDIAVLVLIARLGHVLSSQIHRHFNRGRAATTTQRRLKRLADANLVSRLQFHRRDGGGMPMCYALAPEGRWLLEAREHPAAAAGAALRAAEPEATGREAGEQRLRRARHELHLAGWILALARVLDGKVSVSGREESVLVPPRSPVTRGRPLSPDELRLPGGRVPHDFLRTIAPSVRVEVERFDTLRPHVRVEARGEDRAPFELLVERDDRHDKPGWIAKIERYDQFLSGWSAHTRRYGGSAALPLMAFICRDRSRARECALAADPVLTACRAYAGEYPPDWEYRGRRQIMFVAERDIHEGIAEALALPTLPPDVRMRLAGQGPSTRDALLVRHLASAPIR
ncbi:MAG: replication-relaxation family protein [Solirubrobacteraceae bacterium]